MQNIETVRKLNASNLTKDEILLIETKITNKFKPFKECTFEIKSEINLNGVLHTLKDDSVQKFFNSDLLISTTKLRNLKLRWEAFDRDTVVSVTIVFSDKGSSIYIRGFEKDWINSVSDNIADILRKRNNKNDIKFVIYNFSIIVLINLMIFRFLGFSNSAQLLEHVLFFVIACSVGFFYYLILWDTMHRFLPSTIIRLEEEKDSKIKGHIIEFIIAILTAIFLGALGVS